ncbi:MAG: hypothetical protein JWM64_2927 [Frankiales bacterium]|nr:hypothetical protein [Frankiales bacterium]
MSDYDLVVLGAGATGLGAARTARQAGRRVGLVEQHLPGGDCTHYGCVPSKSLLESARRVQAARSGPRYGFSAEPVVDFAAVMERVQDVVREIEEDESPELLARQGIDLLRGTATFTGPHSLEVDGRTITAERFVVATGSTAAVPPVEGLREVEHLTNRTVFGLREQPAHLLVLGGGPIGVELAQAFRRLGSQVTVVEGAPRLLGREEPEASEVVTAVLEREGVVVRTGVKVVRASAGPTLHLDDGTTLTGSHLLVAVGRVPTVPAGLSTTGASTTENGHVRTDAHLRAARTVWAAGDCTTALKFTHVGYEQGRLAARNAFKPALVQQRFSDRVVPWVTFTEPEVAHVGLTEQQALERHGDRVRVSVVRDTESDRARTVGETDGFVKLIALNSRVAGSLTSRLVGMTVVGPMAGEQIGTGALAMQARVLLARMSTTVAAYPTYDLSVRLAAARFFGTYGGEKARRATSAGG